MKHETQYQRMARLRRASTQIDRFLREDREDQRVADAISMADIRESVRSSSRFRFSFV